jgi:hypothetical protein
MTIEQRDQELKQLYFKFLKQEKRLKNITVFLGKHPFKRVRRSIEKSMQVVKIMSRLAVIRNQACIIASTPIPKYPEGGTVRRWEGPKLNTFQNIPKGLGKGESVIMGVPKGLGKGCPEGVDKTGQNCTTKKPLN